MNNLAVSLVTWYNELGKMEDLNEATVLTRGETSIDDLPDRRADHQIMGAPFSSCHFLVLSGG